VTIKNKPKTKIIKQCLLCLTITLSFQAHGQVKQPQLDHDSIQYYMLEYINVHRLNHKREKLIIHHKLNSAANLHGEYMEYEKKLSHSQTNTSNPFYKGKTPTQRVGLSAGENILYNWIDASYTSKKIAQTLFNQWKSSPGHNNNMLSNVYTYFGFECIISKDTFRSGEEHILYKIYGVQVFTKTI